MRFWNVYYWVAHGSNTIGALLALFFIRPAIYQVRVCTHQQSQDEMAISVFSMSVPAHHQYLSAVGPGYNQANVHPCGSPSIYAA